MVETSVIPENHLTHDTDRVPMYQKTAWKKEGPGISVLFHLNSDILRGNTLNLVYKYGAIFWAQNKLACSQIYTCQV